jgi:transposase
MKPYSQDLRERVIAALEAGDETQSEIAARFAISLSTLEKWWARWQTTDSCAALPITHGPSRTLEICEAAIEAEMAKQPDATLAELCARILKTQKVKASWSMMCRTLQGLELGRKKSHSTIVNAIRHG